MEGVAMNGGIEYASIRVGLRAPRAAVIFDGREHWTFWARLALHAATRVWGGAGFILVPQSQGDIRAEILKAVTAYDPDYVVELEQLARHVVQIDADAWSRWFPGKGLTEEQKKRFLEQNGDHNTPGPGGDAARQKVITACSPHRRRRQDDWEDEVQFLSAGSPNRRFTPVSDIRNVFSTLCVSPPPDWGGLLGVALAAQCGVIDEPRLGAEPQLETTVTKRLWRWLLDQGEGSFGRIQELIHNPSTSDISAVDPARLHTAFDRTMHGLGQVGVRGNARRVALVVGDSASDFALAFAARRIHGGGIWMPAAWWHEYGQEAELNPLGHVVSKLAHHGGNLSVYSTSVENSDLSDLAQRLRTPDFWSDDPELDARNRSQHEKCVNVGPPVVHSEGAVHLGVEEQFAQHLVIPVVRDDSGGVQMVADQPFPDISQPDLLRSDALQWQVDVEFVPNRLPSGRGFDGHSLLTPDQDQFHTWVRSGRDGITFESERYFMVLGGWSRAQRLARPKLRQPSLTEWADLMAQQAGQTMQLSTPGRRVEILRRLWGSREAVESTMASQMLDVLKGFRPSANTTSDAYRPDEGVVLATGDPDKQLREGYLTFKGIATLGGYANDQLLELRSRIDALASIGVIRRGLVLDCSTCGRIRFIGIDELSQTNVCQRCGTDNHLARARWKKPISEPQWYYDLHASVREHLNDHGDVPLLLANHLRTRYRTYTDTPELELRQGDTNLAEADLVALCDRDLIVAEAKSTGVLANTKQKRTDAARKRALLAHVLQADEIILATTEQQWTQASKEAMREAIKKTTWQRSMPRLRLITNLGTSQTSDVYENIQN